MFCFRANHHSSPQVIHSVGLCYSALSKRWAGTLSGNTIWPKPRDTAITFIRAKWDWPLRSVIAAQVDWLAPSIVLVRGLERRRADLELADERVVRLAVVVHCTNSGTAGRAVCVVRAVPDTIYR